MYVIREVEPYSRNQPISRAKIKGIVFGIYLTNEQPYEWETSEKFKSIIKYWDTLEEAQDFLRLLQRMNGVDE